MLHWESVCTGSWGWGGLHAKYCFCFDKCGVLLILAKARCAAMNKALPHGHGKTSHTGKIQTFKICFYSLSKWVIKAIPRWTQPILVQFYSKQEQHREHFCAEQQGRAPAFLGWLVMVQNISLLAQAPVIDPAAVFWPASLPVHSVSLPPLPPHSHSSVTAVTVLNLVPLHL